MTIGLPGVTEGLSALRAHAFLFCNERGNLRRGRLRRGTRTGERLDAGKLAACVAAPRAFLKLEALRCTFDAVGLAPHLCAVSGRRTA